MQIPEPTPESDQDKSLRPVVLIVLAAAALLYVFTTTTKPPVESPSAPATNITFPGILQNQDLAESRNDARRSPAFQRGRDLAKTLCASCHLYPEPELLDRVTWGMEVLPDMALWIGFRLDDKDPYEALGLSERVREANIIPPEPAVTVEDWRAVCLFYLESAPSIPLARPDRARIEPTLPGFNAELPRFRGNPRTTLVQIDPEQRRIILGSVGDRFTGTLDIFTNDGVRESGLRVPSPPVAMTIEKDRLVTTLIGDYGPSDELHGKVVQIPRPGSTGVAIRDLIPDLPRVTDTIIADLNGDGRDDILVCGYGHMLGKLSWFDQQPDNSHQERVLLDQNGVLAARTLDWNRDGRLDIIVMTAQQREGVYLLTNLGNGDFEPRALIEKHPAWGFASFDLADMNGDGHLDLITANGDNGDFTGHVPPMKNYHGYRIHLNDGSFHFTESWSFPVNGAFKVLARDFDMDGDQDIAAASFYADYRNSPEEGFILFENLGDGLSFAPRTFAESSIGRWITLDADDLDGDGDLDIVLGSFGTGPATVPIAIREAWRTQGPPFVILRNKTRN